MKIVLFTHYFYPHIGGIETVAENHARRLAERGHNVTIVTTDVDAKPGRETRDGYTIIRYSSANPLEKWGIPYPVPNPIDSLRTTQAVVDESVDVIHVHGLNYLTSLIPLISARTRNIPVIVHQHTPFVDYSTSINIVQKINDNTVGRGVLRYADYTLAVSENIANYVSSLGAESVTTYYNGVDTEQFSPDIHPTEQEVLYVGRLTQKKGVKMLLEAAQSLDDRSSPVTVRIIGQGEMSRQVRNVAESMDTIEYEGFVNSDLLPELYSRAAALLVPELASDAFPPLTVLEALASGTVPILTSDPISSDHFVEGETYLHSEQNPHCLADASEIALRPDQIRKMESKTRDLAENIFNWESRIDELEKIYQELTATRCRAASS